MNWFRFQLEFRIWPQKLTLRKGRQAGCPIQQTMYKEGFHLLLTRCHCKRCFGYRSAMTLS